MDYLNKREEKFRKEMEKEKRLYNETGYYITCGSLFFLLEIKSLVEEGKITFKKGGE